MKKMKIFNLDFFENFEKIPDKSVDYTFTSPSYARKRNNKVQLPYFDFLVKATDILLEKTKNWVFLNLHVDKHNRKIVYNYIGHYADKIQNIIICELLNPQIPYKMYEVVDTYDMIIILGDKPIKTNSMYSPNHIISSVNPNIYSNIRKEEMYETVSDQLITTYTKEKSLILDPFMGLGTFGVSCKKLNRDFIGFEPNEEFYMIAEERIKGI